MSTVVRAIAALATASVMLVALLPAALGAEYTIVIDKLKFGPVPAELKVGDVIIWQNNDILRHTATARDKSFDVDLPPKSDGRLTLEQAGTFEFFCRFHPGMKGSLVVSP